ncbi:transmembrane sensor [Xanthomonas sacchari]|uniref:FecR family protein n=1 Tax=unclassified Xanthomonas TaxID=2643310 RepID=UPI001369A457|nr:MULTISPECIES: FecR domain-containing protein [unclassified Xanthomonas]MBB6368734.1 transmembrane sensor [Xanthomonas sp. F10]MXV34217.1 histidine kinase [Xanthomonas sp. LMG 8989]
MDSKWIEARAAAWLARRDRGDWTDARQARLDAWLAAATAHRVAFLRLQAAWQESGRLQALGAGQRDGQVPERGRWQGLGGRSAAAPPAAAAAAPDLRDLRFAPRSPARPRRRWPAALAATLLGAAVLSLVWRHAVEPVPTAYASVTGQLRPVALADGSQATLSSDSRIAVALSRAQRHIDLQRGEAFFAVSKDPGRPFVVASGARQVVAVGTRFAVRRDADALRVVVTEGTVRLESADAPHAPPLLLPAGSIAQAGPHGVLVRRVALAEAERALDWRSGYLSFDDTPLQAAVAEFNRYNTIKLQVADAGAAALRVGGNVRWSNVDAFVRLLEQGFPIRAERRGDTVLLHSR